MSTTSRAAHSESVPRGAEQETSSESSLISTARRSAWIPQPSASVVNGACRRSMGNPECFIAKPPVHRTPRAGWPITPRRTHRRRMPSMSCRMFHGDGRPDRVATTTIAPAAATVRRSGRTASSSHGGHEVSGVSGSSWSMNANAADLTM